MRAARGVLAGLGALSLVLRPGAAGAQEILGAQLLDLAIAEVQVTVAGALPSDQVQCLLRDAAGQVRVAGARSMMTGTAAGTATVVSVALPLLAPTEREFAVSLMRADRELARTPWHPVARDP